MALGAGQVLRVDLDGLQPEGIAPDLFGLGVFLGLGLLGFFRFLGLFLVGLGGGERRRRSRRLDGHGPVYVLGRSSVSGHGEGGSYGDGRKEQ